MITLGALLVGWIASVVVGISKTAIPGAALLVTPLVALVFDGRQIAGVALPLLLMADVFAVRWYNSSARWDLLRPLVVWVGLGFVTGAGFFVAVGSGDRVLDVVIGTSILVMVVVQVVRLIRSKGVGVYFITQNPIDIPDTVAGQLGNRVQHALRAFTPRDQAAVKSAAETFLPNPEIDVTSAITELAATGGGRP